MLSSDAWKAFEPTFTEIVNTVGFKAFRTRVLALLMEDATKEERRLLHALPHHKFDWRWEVLETLLGKLVEVWPTLQKYVDLEVLSRDGDLKHVGIGHLASALKDQEGDIPGCELMQHSTFVLARAIGHNGRWLRGCDCHQDILVQHVCASKKKS